MKAAQDRVQRFHEAMSKLGARGSVGDRQHPGVMDQAEAELRARMLLEECTETMVALLGRDMASNMLARRVYELEDLPPGGSIEGVADGLADVLVIVLGTAVAAGIILAPVFDEVMDANERKIGPGARVRADGKLLKPLDWRGPDIAGVLARQKACQHCGKPRQTEPHVCGGSTSSRYYD